MSAGEALADGAVGHDSAETNSASLLSGVAVRSEDVTLAVDSPAASSSSSFVSSASAPAEASVSVAAARAHAEAKKVAKFHLWPLNSGFVRIRRVRCVGRDGSSNIGSGNDSSSSVSNDRSSILTSASSSALALVVPAARSEYDRQTRKPLQYSSCTPVTPDEPSSSMSSSSSSASASAGGTCDAGWWSLSSSELHLDPVYSGFPKGTLDLSARPLRSLLPQQSEENKVYPRLMIRGASTHRCYAVRRSDGQRVDFLAGWIQSRDGDPNDLDRLWHFASSRIDWGEWEWHMECRVRCDTANPSGHSRTRTEVWAFAPSCAADNPVALMQSLSLPPPVEIGSLVCFRDWQSAAPKSSISEGSSSDLQLDLGIYRFLGAHISCHLTRLPSKFPGARPCLEMQLERDGVRERYTALSPRWDEWSVRPWTKSNPQLVWRFNENRMEVLLTPSQSAAEQEKQGQPVPLSIRLFLLRSRFPRMARFLIIVLPLLISLLSLFGDVTSLYSFSYVLQSEGAHGRSELLTILVSTCVRLMITLPFLAINGALALRAIWRHQLLRSISSKPLRAAELRSIPLALLLQLAVLVCNIRILASLRADADFTDYRAVLTGGFAVSVYLSLVAGAASAAVDYALSLARALLDTTQNQRMWYSRATHLQQGALFLVSWFAFGRVSYDLRYGEIASSFSSPTGDAPSHATAAYAIATAGCLLASTGLLSSVSVSSSASERMSLRRHGSTLMLLMLSLLLVGATLFAVVYTLPSSSLQLLQEQLVFSVMLYASLLLPFGFLCCNWRHYRYSLRDSWSRLKKRLNHKYNNKICRARLRKYCSCCCCLREFMKVRIQTPVAPRRA